MRLAPLSACLLSTCLLSACLSLAVSAPVSAQDPPKPKPKSMQEILDASSASDWRTLDPANTLYLDLAGGRVVIELAPQFAPAGSALRSLSSSAGSPHCTTKLSCERLMLRPFQ